MPFELATLAEDAAELVEIEYDTSAPMVDFELAAADGAPVVHPGLRSNIVTRIELPVDDELQRIFDTVPNVITETIRQHRYLPVPTETRAVIADWEAHTRQLQVWISTRSPHDVRTVASRITGVPEHRVRVMIGDVGGSFRPEGLHRPGRACHHRLRRRPAAREPP